MEGEQNQVRFEQAGRVGTITLDRPAARNAINGQIARGIEAAIDRIEDDPEVWVGILAAKGPVFCAGADLRAASEGRGAELATARGGFGGIVKRRRTKPLIAAVDGPALAGGCEIVLACDLVVASTDARFGIPEVKRGLIAGAGGLFRLGRHLPRNLAMQLALTGDPIDAARAAHFGMVNILTDPGQALVGAMALADQVVANAPVSVRLSRQVLLDTAAMDDAEAFEASAAAFVLNCQSADFTEGPAAFLEKRAPRWSGR